jgi:phenylacetate-CoA ligase
LDQLKNIPPLTRSDLQENLNNIISPDFDLKKCSKGSSSGSTGHPVIYYHDNKAKSANKAAVLFSKFLGGYEPGDKWINIWGNPTAVNIDWKKIGPRIKKIFSNEIRYPAYKLNNKENYKALYYTILKEKPGFIYGYTNAIFLLSNYLEDKKIKFDFIKGVFTTAENLYDFQKSKIEEFIGPVFDHYGCSEINGIAAQTKSDNYYSVIDPHVFVEYSATADLQNNTKKIIVTDLYNKVLPFIRYEVGDLAAPLENLNYEKFKIMYSKFQSVDGRVSDIITLPNGGNLVVPSFFGSRMLKNVSGIKQYQIQKLDNKLLINLIVDKEFKDESQNIILENLSEYIPSDIQYDLVFNQQIIYSKNGKFKLFIENDGN